jgi:hypothetical protein
MRRRALGACFRVGCESEPGAGLDCRSSSLASVSGATGEALALRRKQQRVGSMSTVDAPMLSRMKAARFPFDRAGSGVRRRCAREAAHCGRDAQHGLNRPRGRVDSDAKSWRRPRGSAYLRGHGSPPAARCSPGRGVATSQRPAVPLRRPAQQRLGGRSARAGRRTQALNRQRITRGRGATAR